MKTENILFSICARKNSKGLINKNIKKFNKRPLIDWTIDKVLKVKKKHKFTISTDSNEIIKIAKRRKIDLFFKRNIKLSNSKTPKIDVWRDLLKRSEKNYGQKFDYLIDFDCTNPLVKSIDINKMIYREFAKIKNNCDLMLMVTESNKNPYFNMLKMKNGFFDIVIKDRLHTRRQTAPKTYDHVAGVYIIKRNFLLKSKNIFDGKVKGYFVDNICSFDIDNYSNFEIAEALHKKYKIK